ncbi:MAG TPA: energy transducer TonB [Bacteroidia bacterium]|jgi:protein TonB|nr:energy transducer TonB [Bacteroidia bacterium]
MTALVAEKEERENKGAAYIGTILFHAAILLFLILYKIITPIPPYPHPVPPEINVDMALDYGNGINGSGTVEANNMGNNPQHDNSANQNTSKATPQSSSTITNDAETNPSMNSSKKPTKTDKIDTVTRPVQPQISTELASLENKFKHSKGQPGGNGTSDHAGNAGDPNGRNPGMSSGNGGMNFSLSGRSLLSHPEPVNVSQDVGTVVVEITVDPNGNVIKAMPGAKGSTTSSAYLFSKAKETALATKFTRSADVNTPEQEGTMSIKFEIK